MIDFGRRLSKGSKTKDTKNKEMHFNIQTDELYVQPESFEVLEMFCRRCQKGRSSPFYTSATCLHIPKDNVAYVASTRDVRLKKGFLIYARSSPL